MCRPINKLQTTLTILRNCPKFLLSFLNPFSFSHLSYFWILGSVLHTYFALLAPLVWQTFECLFLVSWSSASWLALSLVCFSSPHSLRQHTHTRAQTHLSHFHIHHNDNNKPQQPPPSSSSHLVHRSENSQDHCSLGTCVSSLLCGGYICTGCKYSFIYFIPIWISLCFIIACLVGWDWVWLFLYIFSVQHHI